jgi:putative transposase
MERDILKKSSGHLLRGTAMKYIFMRDHREVFPVDLMRRSLGMDSSGFYAWLKRPESPRRRDNLRLLTEKSKLFTEEVARAMAVLESMQN